MTPYKNLGGDSNVVAYENGVDYIKIKFAGGRWTLYTYTDHSAGNIAVCKMQDLAKLGQGLNSYVSRNRPPFSSKQ